ncbi:MAG: hypothetical protein K9J13_10650 [Saprospiraceae bacterium]|nr:hypothetical protein [Saprospiraceae bacterium]
MEFFKSFLKSKDSVNSAEFIKNAENLVQFANIMVVGSQEMIINEFPQLNAASEIKNWDLFCTVSATFAAFMRAGSFVKDRKLKKNLIKLY